MRRSDTKEALSKKPRSEDLEDEFVRHIEEGNVAELQDLFFNQITSPQQRQELVNLTKDESTALHIAAEKSQPAVVRWLLSDAGGRAAGFNQVLDTVRSDETNALHMAVGNGHVETCKAIVEGCKEENGERSEMLNACDSDGNTILHIAAENSLLDAIQWILTEGRSAGFEGTANRNSSDATAFLVAVRNGDVAVCRLLVGCLENDEDARYELVNSVDEDENTALHIAAENNDDEMIKWLLSTDEDGGHFDNVEELNEDGGMTALHLAVYNGSFAAFLAIIKGCSVENGRRKAVLNARDSSESTVLHKAALNNGVDFIKWLLSETKGRAEGFDEVLAENDDTKTALHVAVEEGNEEAFFALVKRTKVENGERAELLNAEDKSKFTVLHFASWKGNIEIIEWLLSDSGGRANGFNKVCSVDAHGRNVLHLAVRSRKKRVFQAIVEGCKDEEREQLLNGVDSQGRMLLHAVAGSESPSSIEWLFSETGGIACGFKRDNLFALTGKKENVLHIAAKENGSTEILDFLLSYCSNTSERLRLFLGRDDKGWTIFFHAARLARADLIAHILRTHPEESKMIIDTRDNRGMTALHRLIIHGLNQESRWEWSNIYIPESNIANAIAALLGMKGGGLAAAAAAAADPNVGLKFE